MDLDSLKKLLKELEVKLQTIKEALKINEKKIELEKLESMTMQDGFWENSKLQS